MHERTSWRVFVKDEGIELYCFLEEAEEIKRWSDTTGGEKGISTLIAITAVHTKFY